VQEEKGAKKDEMVGWHHKSNRPMEQDRKPEINPCT